MSWRAESTAPVQQMSRHMSIQQPQDMLCAQPHARFFHQDPESVPQCEWVMRLHA